MTDRVVATLGLQHRCTVRAVDVSVADIETGAGPAFDDFVVEARTALAVDVRMAVVVGCAGLTELVASLTDALRGAVGVDGVAAATTAVEGLLRPGAVEPRARARGARA